MSLDETTVAGDGPAPTTMRHRVGEAVNGHLRLWSMMVLTMVTGMLDAVGYLGLDRIFTGNMTGNIVILGMGVAGEDGLPIVGPLVALFAFVLGAALAGVTLRSAAPGWNIRVTAIFAVGTLALLAAGVTLLVVDVQGNSPLGIAIASVIAVDMGAQALAARFLAVKDMTTVVVTSTITSLAGESFVGQGPGRLFNRRLWAILVLFVGAVIGALLLRVDIAIPVLLGAALTAAVAALGHWAWDRAAG
ncbi:YoaK family protein [Rhodococcoides fascians]|uniref:YoaK family protein n=1 Tax=Rhodococcoides fascians TaxID=1828 RepID=UPI000B0F2311|nr:YoaK family protein [Rhodococcus fascians]